MRRDLRVEPPKARQIDPAPIRGGVLTNEVPVLDPTHPRARGRDHGRVVVSHLSETALLLELTLHPRVGVGTCPKHPEADQHKPDQAKSARLRHPSQPPIPQSHPFEPGPLLT